MKIQTHKIKIVKTFNYYCMQFALYFAGTHTVVSNHKSTACFPNKLLPSQNVDGETLTYYHEYLRLVTSI